ncbi:hypothetical protein TrVE_jg8069 [Triparma verrucosa]|uniref:Uncharacterized protein n=1 Tax=Triparma verrucosa TaxID=1606542 RepID=A0A9W7BIX8_9STRA|nr:hypothetical protein TrVE_jg8069 [Triparma verrucosa]
MSRSLINSTSRLLSLSTSSDKLLGTERLLLSKHRKQMEAEFGALAATANDIISTTYNTSASWLKQNHFFSDMNRDNDLSYYKVGRGRVGTDPITGEEFSFEVQSTGGASLVGKNHYCVPRAMGVSAGEEMRFAGFLGRINMQVLKASRPESASSAGLLGAAVNFSGPTSFVEYQIQQLAKESPDAFVVSGCDDESQRHELKEMLKRNEKRMVYSTHRTVTGMLVTDSNLSEIGFDIPAILVKEDGDSSAIDDIY